MIVKFVVEWDSVGYYAKKQNTYAWCFTKDISQANTYSSHKTALARASGDRHGSGHKDRPFRIVQVDGNMKILEMPEQFTDPLLEKRNQQKLKPAPEIISLKMILNGSTQTSQIEG